MQRRCLVNPRYGVLQVQQVYQLCQIARRYVDAAMMLQKEERQVSCMQLIGMLALMIHGGDELVISATGSHAERAIASIERILEEETAQITP